VTARTTLRSVAPPKQQRSQETLARLLDAGESLIEEKGLADVSVPDIVQRARSSVGGFYARFRDKAELLRALEERFFAQLGVRVEEISRAEHWGDAPIPAIVRLCMGELVETFREREALIRAFMARAAQDAVFMEDAHRFRCKVSDGIVRLLLTRRSAIRHADPALAIDFGVQLAFGMMHHWVIFGGVQAGGRRLSDRDLVEELSRSFLGYLAQAPLEEPA
jgi:AcrR family transcriptional regulator